MALGGGVFVTQNKTLPGSYINFVNASKASSNVGDRGTVAIAYALGKEAGTVIEITKSEFLKDSESILGVKADDAKAVVFREIFAHATKCIIYDIGSEGAKTVAEAMSALEPYEFNVLAAYTSTAEDVTAYVETIKTWRDNGKKCQAVVYNAVDPDHEGIINLVSTVADEDADAHALVAWLAGAEAGCALNRSCTNVIYDGEYTVVCNHTQEQLVEFLENGKVALHLVYGEVRVLEDINSLVTTTAEKGDDFKSNQTIRVIDQIANDIAKLFNTKYLGRIPNNASGRSSLWADIVAHHRQLEAINAIEYFDSGALTVAQGESKKSVVVNDAITVTNSMSQLYMTVVIQ